MRRLLLASCLISLAAAAPNATRRGLLQAERNQAAQEAASAEAAEHARSVQAEERRLAGERVAAAARLRMTEEEAAEASRRVDDLAARRAAAEERLAERAKALGPLLPLIERLTLYPAETLLAVPAPPEAALRGLLVLRGLARQLERDAATLRAERSEVQRLAQGIEAELPRLRAAQASQRAQSAELDRQIAASRETGRRLDDAATEAARRAAAGAARAGTLRAAVAQLDAERARTEARAQEENSRSERRRARRDDDAAESRPRTEMRQEAAARVVAPNMSETAGLLRAPVAGTVVRAWGERTDAGPANGIVYRAPPSARVVAPCDGRVVFAGPFRSFGLLMIVDCGGGYHLVLSGLERLDVQVGMAVRAGEPVGVMPGWDPQVPGPRPSLYVELRRGGQPMNPAPFLRAKG